CPGPALPSSQRRRTPRHRSAGRAARPHRVSRRRPASRVLRKTSLGVFDASRDERYATRSRPASSLPLGPLWRRFSAPPTRANVAMAAGETLLELNGVTKRYGAVVAVDGISASLHPGEYLCLLGPSGCGKTTLLRLIAGFEVPDGGVVRLHGRDMTSVPPERRDVNVVFQNYALFPHLTVAENVGFGLRMKGVPRAEARERVTDALRQVRLEREANRLPRQISGGQQQRVALARALVNRPALLLLDEPLSALDPELRQQVQDELRRVQRETGIAFLHITHDQDEAPSLADRVAVMRSGRFEHSGTQREVYAAPASRFVASFVGGANLLEGRVAGEGWVELGSETS